MHEALGWLLQHYKSVKLWMGLESDDGVELYLIATPTQKEQVVERLFVEEDHFELFEAQAAEAQATAINE